MLSARADLAIEGPGLTAHVHGDGPLLIVDIRPRAAAILQVVANWRALVSSSRVALQALRASGLRVHVRIGGRTIARLP